VRLFAICELAGFLSVGRIKLVGAKVLICLSVSLVGYLDADKEGFLRFGAIADSRPIGRAARNP